MIAIESPDTLARATRTELAQRSSDGVDVTLVWVPGDRVHETVVCVCDQRTGAYFEIPTKASRALEVYYHPFAYRAFSAIDYEDGWLASQPDFR